MKTAPSLLLVTLASVSGLAGQGGELFEKVVGVLERRYYDRQFRRHELSELAANFRDAARATETLEEERIVIHALLAQIPASHLALYSRATTNALLGEVMGEPRPTFGCQVEQRAGRFFAARVLDGGPAARAGLVEGDSIVALDGVLPGRSPRLDWRSDDAHLPDPPVHQILIGDDPELTVRVRRGSEERELELRAVPWSGARATRASVRVVEHDGFQLGYLHLWYVFNGSSQLLSRTLRKTFANCDGVVLDLRGRGGNAMEVAGIVKALARHRRSGGCPVVAIVDRATRSAKEIIAHRILEDRLAVLVGERTAGAVLPATFENVGHGSVLMFPSFELGSYSHKLERVGVEPDIVVTRRQKPGSTTDPLREAALLHLSNTLSR